MVLVLLQGIQSSYSSIESGTGGADDDGEDGISGGASPGADSRHGTRCLSAGIEWYLTDNESQTYGSKWV